VWPTIFAGALSVFSVSLLTSTTWSDRNTKPSGPPAIVANVLRTSANRDPQILMGHAGILPVTVIITRQEEIVLQAVHRQAKNLDVQTVAANGLERGGIAQRDIVFVTDAGPQGE